MIIYMGADQICRIIIIHFAQKIFGKRLAIVYVYF